MSQNQINSENMKIMIYKYTRPMGHAFLLSMLSRIEKADRQGRKWREMAAVDYFSFPTDRGNGLRGDWH
jgi:hypothetical protein